MISNISAERVMCSIIISGLVILTSINISVAESQNNIDARAIMGKVDRIAWQATNNAISRIRLTSCKFGIQNTALKCNQQPRVKVIDSIQKHFGKDGRDNKSLMIVREPGNERGVSILNHSYNSTDVDNETWLYLSTLNRVKRIAAGNSEDEVEPASVFGSEFTTEDLETGKLDDFTYSLLEEREFKGRPVWVIQLTPTPEKAKRSLYSKSVSWIDKKRLVPLKASAYDKRGNEVRRFKFDNIKKINGIWLARSSTVLNLVSNRLSNLLIQDVTFNANINDDFITQRSLTDSGFRERQLSLLKAQLK